MASTHAAAFRDAADQLSYLHGELIYSKVPAYDVSTAMHVLRHGGFSALPSIIESEVVAVGGTQRPALISQHAYHDGSTTTSAEEAEKQREAVLRRFNFFLRSKLLEERLPDGLKVVEISQGSAILCSTSKQFSAVVALVPAPSDEVILTKWSPPVTDDVEEEEEEVQQQQPTTTAVSGGGGRIKTENQDSLLYQSDVENMDIDTVDATAAPSNPTTTTKTGKKSKEASMHWRWRLLSFRLLPSHSEAILPPALVSWLHRNIEDRMWAAADIQRLIALGKSELVVVPPPPMTRKQKDQRQKELDDSGRGAPVARTSSKATSGPNGTATASGSGGRKGMLQSSVSISMTEKSGGGDDVDGTDNEKEAVAGAPGVIPEWTQSPLAALHAVLQHVSAKLALSLLVMKEAKTLEQAAPSGGVDYSYSWGGGNLRVSKLSDGFGVCLAIWPHVPILSIQELSSFSSSCSSARRLLKISTSEGEEKEQQPGKPLLNKKEDSEERKNGSTIEIVVPENGTIQSTCIPPLMHPDTAAHVPLSLWTPSGSLSTEQLLCSVGLQLAAFQLTGVLRFIQSSTKHTKQLDEVLGAHSWSIDRVEVDVMQRAVPALQCSTTVQNDDVSLFVQMNLKTGQPFFILGAALVEASVQLAENARHIVKGAQSLLERRLKAALEEVLSNEVNSRAVAWTAAVSDVLVETWSHLIAAQRKLNVVHEAVPCGFSQSLLPRFLEGMKFPNLLNDDDDDQLSSSSIRISSESTVALKTPQFAPPKLFSLSEVVPVGKQGSLTCFVVGNVGKASSSGGGGGVVSQLSLAQCWSTPRGVPVSLRRIIPIPLEIFNSIGSGSTKKETSSLEKKGRPQSGGGGGGGVKKRKRESEDDDYDEKEKEQEQETKDASSINWPRMKDWCLRVTAVDQLEAQLEAANLPFSKPATAEHNSTRVLRVPLAQSWLFSDKNDGQGDDNNKNSNDEDLKNQFSSSLLASHGEEVLISMHHPPTGTAASIEEEDSCFVVQLCGGTFNTWQSSLLAHGMEVSTGVLDCTAFPSDASANSTSSSSPPPRVIFTQEGQKNTIQLHCSLSAGVNAGEMVVIGAAALCTHSCALRLSAALKLLLHGNDGVMVLSVGLDCIHLKVKAAPPSSSSSLSAAAGGVDVDVRLKWGIGKQQLKETSSAVKTDTTTTTTTATTTMPGRLMMSATTAAATTLTSKTTAELLGKEADILPHQLMCSISMEPSVPDALLRCLETMVERGDESTFLNVLSNVAANAAALQACALSPAAQRAAGLLPNAVIIEKCEFEYDKNVSAGDGDEPFHGHCLLLVRQLGRALQLGVWFQSSGSITLRARQLPPPPLLVNSTTTTTTAAAGVGGVESSSEEDNWLAVIWSQIEGVKIENSGGNGVWPFHAVCLPAADQLEKVISMLFTSVSRKV